MSADKSPTKAAISVSEMAEKCLLSRSRFLALVKAGVFPKPVQNPACKRPYFDQELQQKCLEIRQSGVGLNGLPVMFNRKIASGEASKTAGRTKPSGGRHAELIEALKSLGLVSTAEQVGQAMKEVFPNGIDGLNQGEVIKALFLHLKRRDRS